MTNPFTAQYINEHIDPSATLHMDPIESEDQARVVAEDLFRVFSGDDSLDEIGTVEQLAAALYEHYTAEALADCECNTCKRRRGEAQ